MEQITIQKPGQRQLSCSKLETELRLMEELDKAAKELEREIRDQHEVLQEIAEMIHGQGIVVDSIVQKTDSIKVKIGNGAAATKVASKYRSKSRRLKSILIGAAACIVAVIVIIIIV